MADFCYEEDQVHRFSNGKSTNYLSIFGKLYNILQSPKNMRKLDINEDEDRNKK